MIEDELDFTTHRISSFRVPHPIRMNDKIYYITPLKGFNNASKYVSDALKLPASALLSQACYYIDEWEGAW